MTDSSKLVNPNLSSTSSEQLSGSANIPNESVVPGLTNQDQQQTVQSQQPSIQTQYPDPNLNTQMPQVPYKRPFNFIKVGFLVMIVILLLVGGYVGYQQFKLGQNKDNSSEALTPTVLLTSVPAEGSPSPASTDENTTPAEALEANPFVEVIDFGNCSPGDGYSRSVENGSTYLSVVDVDASNDICKVELLNETGGGYTKYSCSIPRSTGTVGFGVSELGSDFSAILSYCSES